VDTSALNPLGHLSAFVDTSAWNRLRTYTLLSPSGQAGCMGIKKAPVFCRCISIQVV